jgi:arylsulfatase A-like enzyme
MADAVAGPQDPPWGSGEHGYQPARRAMHAIFYAAGPGLGRGVRLGPIRHVDVAPTLTRAAGLPAPADAEGRVVTEALAGE